jgi:transcription antitermination factor NusG
MATLAISQKRSKKEPAFLEDYCFEPRWYAVYTSANHERRVAAQLGQRSVEHFLPLYESTRRWKDRRVKLQLPLFPGYVFVRLALQNRLQVLQIPSVVHLVSFNGHPTPLPEEDIRAIRTCLCGAYQIEPHPYLRVGRRVRVKTGPLQGLEGIILRRKNRTRLVLSLELIMRSVAVEIDEKELELATLKLSGTFRNKEKNERFSDSARDLRQTQSAMDSPSE